MQYLRYVKSKCGICCITFDGYSGGPSIKDHEHERRKTVKSSADIKIEEKLLISVSQELFLFNKKNRHNLLIYFYVSLFNSRRLPCDTKRGRCGYRYCHDRIKFDLRWSVVVVADDTDILVLLLYHWKPDMQDLYMRSEMRTRNKSL